MVALKLQRVGRHNRPHFRLIAIDKLRNPQSKAKELLGHFDPKNRKESMVLKADRISYWLSVGAQPTPVVNNLLIDAGIIKGEKQSVTAQYTPKIKEAAEKETKTLQEKMPQQNTELENNEPGTQEAENNIA